MTTVAMPAPWTYVPAIAQETAPSLIASDGEESIVSFAPPTTSDGSVVPTGSPVHVDGASQTREDPATLDSRKVPVPSYLDFPLYFPGKDGLSRASPEHLGHGPVMPPSGLPSRPEHYVAAKDAELEKRQTMRPDFSIVWPGLKYDRSTTPVPTPSPVVVVVTVTAAPAIPISEIPVEIPVETRVAYQIVTLTDHVTATVTATAGVADSAPAKRQLIVPGVMHPYFEPAPVPQTTVPAAPSFPQPQFEPAPVPQTIMPAA